MANFDTRMSVDIDDDDIIEWVKKNKNPEDVFSKDELSDWVDDNGFIKEEE